MTWFSRLPLMIWSLYATSIIFLLGTPVLATTVLLLAAERLFGIGVFDANLQGDPVLFQHLFWFYSHPAVYIMILPGMGDIVSEVIPCFMREDHLRVPLDRLFQRGHRRLRILGVGAPHVRRRRVGLRGHGLLGVELPGRHSLGDQSLQLDGDALQRLDFLPDTLRYCFASASSACSPSAG